MNVLRAIRRFFSGSVVPSASPVFARQTQAWFQATILVRVYYVVLCYFAISLLPSWDGFIHVRAASFVPLWPVVWLRHVPLQAGIGAILGLYLGGTILAALRPDWRTARLLAWLGLFEFVAYNNSFGKIGHSLHAWVLTGLALVFLPSWQPGSRVRRQAFLQIFWVAQAALMTTYAMSGLSKLIGCVYQLTRGEMSLLNVHSFSYQVAGRLLETDARSGWGAWFIGHPVIGWLCYVGMVYIQISSVWAVFRPRLLRPWGLALLLFHVGSFFVFTILFSPNVVLVGLLLLAAPQARAWDFGPRLWADLPLIGGLVRRAAPSLCREVPCAS